MNDIGPHAERGSAQPEIPVGLHPLPAVDGTEDGTRSTEGPRISLVLATRNRAEQLADAVRSILWCERPDYELVIIDQSDDDASRTALDGLGDHGPLRYFRAPRTGLCDARNLGIARARADIIAFTDDDCDVPPDWLTGLVDAFERDPKIGMVFTDVRAAEHDSAAGCIPAYVRAEPYVARSVWEKPRVEGMGAGMALRRSACLQLGGFDPQLGPGANLSSAGDSDMALRCLQAGFWVFETPAVYVVHRGFRTWPQRTKLIERYMLGLGAMYAKHIKCARWSVLWPMAHLARRWAFGAPVIDLGPRPPRGFRLFTFLRGFANGLLHPVDRRLAQYLPTDSGPALRDAGQTRPQDL